MEEKIINEAIEMTKGVPGKDVLVPLAQEEKELAPYPQVEYTIVEAPTMDKLVRDVNTHLANGRVCDGGVQISSGPIARFYQSMERRNVDGDTDKTIHIPGLEDEPDLYEDVEKDAV